MDQGPLVNEQIDAARKFLGEFEKYCPIRVAFWLKDTEKGRWYLYIASDQITDDNFDLAYGEVVRINGRLRDPWFDSFQVKVINANEPLAKTALDIQSQLSGRIPARIHGGYFGGLGIAELYIYPPSIPASVQ